MTSSPFIPKDPVLPKSLDFFALRRDAIERIAALGSRHWTDYNAHDPGITLLEALLFALTDLAYRARWDVADLLAGASDQAFFTAREILTVEPVTADDYRRLFIDLDRVRNAWVVCKECACGPGLPAVRGLYDVDLELESDDVLGDLNDHRVTRTFRIGSGADVHEVTLEARFPRVELVDRERFAAFLALDRAALSIDCIRFMRAKTAEAPSNSFVGDDDLRRHRRDVFFATLLVDTPDGPLAIQDVSTRFFTSAEGSRVLRVDDLVGALEDAGEEGSVALYKRKEELVEAILDPARARYHAHRNLDEDLCRLGILRVGHVGVCAEIDVTAGADLERVQAEVWLAIEEYLAPSIPFRSLDEMRARGHAVEDIFRGPALENGFIEQSDLDAATIRRVVRASDIVNLLMDIEGVESVGSLLMTRYDDDGKPVTGVAETAAAERQSWLLHMDPGRAPRLYHELSTFRFRKDGLPFAIDEDEARSTLVQLRGEKERPKRSDRRNDLPVPVGRARKAASISPVQYLLPRNYGVSAEGLPGHVRVARRIRARQLKAYLMVFEQLIGNAFEQVAHLGDLFSTRPTVGATHFAHDFTDEIAGYADVVAADATQAVLQRLLESDPEFLVRRNAFLDHLVARFGLDFGEYALLLRDWKGDAVAGRELIADKLGVLKVYPTISSGRFKAFDRYTGALLPENIAVLKRRIALLLGYAELRFEWLCDATDPAAAVTVGFTLVDVHDEIMALGNPAFEASSETAVKRIATNAVLRSMSRESAYTLRATGDGYRLIVRDSEERELAEIAEDLPDVEAGHALRAELCATSAMARSIVVEHLLLRPKFPGDAVYAECRDCEDADPWSFRLTLVMPGWTAPYAVDLDWRDFADRTIREEVPSHLLPKVCWVGDDEWEFDECDPLVRVLRRIVEAHTVDADGRRPVCEQALSCALAAHELHAGVFARWYAGKERRVFGRRAATRILAAVFAGTTAADVACEIDLSPAWSMLQEALVEHFAEVVVHGMQFTRFEEAWYAWLDEDSRFDWGEERLAERLRGLLAERLRGSTDIDLCACAESLLATHGAAFSAWMEAELAEGRELAAFEPFTPPPVVLCPGAAFSPGTRETVERFLADEYAAYTSVSYRLTLLVRLLEGLTNTYPAATLHDCEDGSDENPVRLNRTALGSLSPGASETADLSVEPQSPVEEEDEDA